MGGEGSLCNFKCEIRGGQFSGCAFDCSGSNADCTCIGGFPGGEGESVGGTQSQSGSPVGVDNALLVKNLCRIDFASADGNGITLHFRAVFIHNPDTGCNGDDMRRQNDGSCKGFGGTFRQIRCNEFSLCFIFCACRNGNGTGAVRCTGGKGESIHGFSQPESEFFPGSGNPLCIGRSGLIQNFRTVSFASRNVNVIRGYGIAVFIYNADTGRHTIQMGCESQFSRNGFSVFIFRLIRCGKGCLHGVRSTFGNTHKSGVGFGAGSEYKSGCFRQGKFSNPVIMNISGLVKHLRGISLTVRNLNDVTFDNVTGVAVITFVFQELNGCRTRNYNGGKCKRYAHFAVSGVQGGG